MSVLALINQVMQPDGNYTVILTPYALAFPFKKNFYGWVHYTTGNEMFVEWVFTAYSTQSGSTYGPTNPYVDPANTTFANTDSKIEYYEPSVSFSNVVGGYYNNGNIFYQFDFPGTGYHKMICNIKNSMKCP